MNSDTPFHYIRLRLLNRIPIEEVCSKDFFQAQINRMEVSHFKYGNASEAYPEKVDAVKNARFRISEYLKTGNMEFLVDAANFLMIEWMFPRHKKARFGSQDTGKNELR